LPIIKSGGGSLPRCRQESTVLRGTASRSAIWVRPTRSVMVAREVLLGRGPLDFDAGIRPRHWVALCHHRLRCDNERTPSRRSNPTGVYPGRPSHGTRGGKDRGRQDQSWLQPADVPVRAQRVLVILVPFWRVLGWCGRVLTLADYFSATTDRTLRDVDQIPMLFHENSTS
jgi:hypothetical protein